MSTRIEYETKLRDYPEITLSTCEYSRVGGRMVVVAKKIEPSYPEVDGNA